MDTQKLIDRLADELAPVKPVQPRDGMGILLLGTMVSTMTVIGTYGARADILAGATSPIVVIRACLLALLGLAAGVAATGAARPSVGKGHNGWGWALAAALVLPATAAILFCYRMITHEPFAQGDMDFHYWRYCAGIGGGSGLLIGTGLTLWLRRGAPTALNRAGWLVGLASGAFGTFAYSLHCPSNSIYYVGLFYALAVAVCAGLGRLIVPPVIRW